MKQQYANPEEFAKDVVKHTKDGWVNGQFTVGTTVVAIKAYGLWVQRMNVHCLTDGGEFRTQKAMREFIVEHMGRD